MLIYRLKRLTLLCFSIFLFFAIAAQIKLFYEPQNEKVLKAQSISLSYYEENQKIDIQDKDAQYNILKLSAPYSKNEIIGSWLQIKSFTEQSLVYAENADYGKKGYYHLLNLKKDNRYELYYSYKNKSGKCMLQTKIAESGSFYILNSEITLAPERFYGNNTHCNRLTKVDEKEPINRRFVMALAGDKKHMVLKGINFEYTICTKSEFMEGFKKIN
ncbi:hypothetical protein [Chondrinema litorale]|uniref:hypothetical protein n=1 Tax=Chondrinema litorale TaxID=2994555 RepID=UPI002542A851|nr:hypothetical protein [Chondrinema litorale]UZR98034.1 hypothetical protein OQ292_28845 [Chondrinema litorale]